MPSRQPDTVRGDVRLELTSGDLLTVPEGDSGEIRR